jgi:hypothetical protein
VLIHLSTLWFEKFIFDDGFSSVTTNFCPSPQDSLANFGGI